MGMASPFFRLNRYLLLGPGGSLDASRRSHHVCMVISFFAMHMRHACPLYVVSSTLLIVYTSAIQPSQNGLVTNPSPHWESSQVCRFELRRRGRGNNFPLRLRNHIAHPSVCSQIQSDPLPTKPCTPPRHPRIHRIRRPWFRSCRHNCVPLTRNCAASCCVGVAFR